MGSSEGYHYYISFTDDARRFSDVKVLVNKKDAVPWIKDHATMIEGKFGKLQAEGEKLDDSPLQTTQGEPIKFMTQNYRIYRCPKRLESPIMH